MKIPRDTITRQLEDTFIVYQNFEIVKDCTDLRVLISDYQSAYHRPADAILDKHLHSKYFYTDAVLNDEEDSRKTE